MIYEQYITIVKQKFTYRRAQVELSLETRYESLDKELMTFYGQHS